MSDIVKGMKHGPAAHCTQHAINLVIKDCKVIDGGLCLSKSGRRRQPLDRPTSMVQGHSPR